MSEPDSLCAFLPVTLTRVATGVVHLVDADEKWDGESMRVTLCARRGLARVDETGDLVCRSCKRVARILKESHRG